jgi:hypothetical protein
MGRDTFVESLDLSEHRKSWLVRLAWSVYFYCCLGAGLYFLLNKETWGSRITVIMVTGLALVPYSLFYRTKWAGYFLDAIF